MDVFPDNVSALKVAELKDVCSQLGLSTKGVKKDLIARIEDAKNATSSKESVTSENLVEWVKEAADLTEAIIEQVAEHEESVEPVVEPVLNLEGPPVDNETTLNVRVDLDEHNVQKEVVAKTNQIEVLEQLRKLPEKETLLNSIETVEQQEDIVRVNVNTIETPHDVEEPILDLDVDAEEESLLDVTKSSSDLTLEMETHESRDTIEEQKKEKNVEDGELVTPNDQEEGLVEDSMTEETAEISGNASQEPEIEDRSREVDGTKQRTVVVPAQGDRPSFDIKIVNPVKAQSKPVKIRKRNETPAVDGVPAEEGGSKEKKRKWVTSSGDSQNCNIVISTDVLNTIVSNKSPTAPKDKSRESTNDHKSPSLDRKRKSKDSKIEDEGLTEKTKRVSIESVKEDELEIEAREDNDGEVEEEGEKDKEKEEKRETRKKKKGGKEEDLEEGEHKSKHALISFSVEAEPKKTIVPKVKGRNTEDAAATPLGVDLPKKEPDEIVPEARNPVSTIVHVMRLTRPFTLLQLKGLLGKFGEIIDDEFWIDDIKSQCYVKFKEEDSAKNCRESLFGCKWPSTNPKTLKLEFVSQLQLDDVRGILKKISKNRSESKEADIGETKFTTRRSPNIIRTAAGLESRSKRKEWKRRSRSLSRESFSDYPSVNKMARADPTRKRRESRDREDNSRFAVDPKVSARREQEMRDRYHERMEQKRKYEEERLKKEQLKEKAPVKLLDDLFRKTKADPCIYWLPLTEDEMVVRDRKRAAEQKELEQLQQQSAMLKTTLETESSRHRDHSMSPPRRGVGGGGYRRNYSPSPDRRYGGRGGGSDRNNSRRNSPPPPFYGQRSGCHRSSGSYGGSRGYPRDSGRHR